MVSTFSWLKRLPRPAACHSVLVAALSLSCSSEPEAEPPRVLHVFNPFRLQGLRPHVHSGVVANSSEIGQMGATATGTNAQNLRAEYRLDGTPSRT
jgi:hypothetical protein